MVDDKQLIIIVKFSLVVSDDRKIIVQFYNSANINILLCEGERGREGERERQREREGGKEEGRGRETERERER